MSDSYIAAGPPDTTRQAGYMGPSAESSHAATNTIITGAPIKEAQNLWHHAVKSTIYELDMAFDRSRTFMGMMRSNSIGNLHWTRLMSTQVRYQRRSQHCDRSDPQILVCMPLAGEAHLEQLGNLVRSRPGQILLEYSDAPYKFEYPDATDMWTLRIPELLLGQRIRNPVNFCAASYDVASGVGKLFIDYLANIAANNQLTQSNGRHIIGNQLIDLLALVLECDTRTLTSSSSSVKSAHLARISQFVQRNIASPGLTAEHVAASCGISVRYLHLLFKDTDHTFSAWVRETRLERAHEALRSGRSNVTVSQVAYSCGFNSHAQFSQAFRQKYGMRPSDLLHSALRHPESDRHQ